MAGTNDRVHGYNSLYRANDDSRFASFVLANGHPKNFIYRKVEGVNKFDHQGHIIPQNIMNLVLNDMMIEMSDVCDNANDVLVYINHPPHNAAWLAPAYEYGVALGIPMFEWGRGPKESETLDIDYAEDRVGGLFSIVTWNPVNICRAPADDCRNGVPGNTIDTAVLAYLSTNDIGVNPGWLQAAQTLSQAVQLLTLNSVRAYLAACTSTLTAQLTTATGYYAFPWHAGKGDVGLVPGVS